MARKRINLNAICSSENYKRSRKLHEEYIHKVTITTKIKHQYYIKVFGKLMQITEIEAKRISSSIEVITKEISV